ncbi:MAG: ribosome recycling factor [Nitrospirota bacterium]
MIEDIKNKTLEEMEHPIEYLQNELFKIRTGRASVSLLDRIMVDYYGTKTPLKQVASISIPDSRSVSIQPWETRIIGEIEKAILTSDLGLNPNNDGKIIRISIPPLTEERRKELVKLAKKMGETAKINVRNIRRDSNEELKRFQKESRISEDQLKTGYDETQKITDQYIKKIDDIIKKKEKEILEV